ncbi:chromosomal replication initiator protein DnaA [Candidatus Poribacteria bacterium]|nr:chromosomal replication initiator protein DnaA [Candidatus Poribacteria bacterium]
MTRMTHDVWDRTRDMLRGAVGEDEFSAWLSPVTFEGFCEQTNKVTLSVTSEFYQRWIARRYLEQLRVTLQEALETETPISVEVVIREGTGGNGTSGSEPEADAEVVPIRQIQQGFPVRGGQRQSELPEQTRLNPRYTFDGFVVGESNRYAHAAAQSVADPESQAFNPLFLYGPSGLGKTHLMQAIGHAYVRKNRGARVLYVTSEQFINSFIESIQNKRSLEFRTQFRNVDVLLIDDVQFLMGKERTQHEVFHTFNALFDAGKKIVLTSDRPPRDLATLEERLRSRFEWGVIADMQPPDLETRIAILRQKARQEGLKLPSDVLTYIAERVKSNIRELEGALKRIKVYAGLHNCSISLEAAREVLGHLVAGQAQNRITIEDIQRAVCDYFEITPQQLLGSNRSKKFSQPRHLALYLGRELTDLSFPDIAAKFGGKDHTSVIYACRKVKKLAENDSDMAGIVAYLTKQVQRGQAN